MARTARVPCVVSRRPADPSPVGRRPGPVCAGLVFRAGRVLGGRHTERDERRLDPTLVFGRQLVALREDVVYGVLHERRGRLA